MKRMPWTAFFSVTMPEAVRAESQGAFRLAGAGQRLDLLVGDVPAAQAQQARLGELLHASLRRAASILQRSTPCMAMAYSRCAETSSGL
jgi:hypothetical protein